MAKEIWTGAGKDRGLFLTIMLILTILGKIVDIVSSIFVGVIYAQSKLPFWYAPTMIALSILVIVSVYGMWNLKKWGVFLNVLLMLGLIVFGYLWMGKLGILGVSLSLFFPVLLYIAIFRKWKVFN